MCWGGQLYTIFIYFHHNFGRAPTVKMFNLPPQLIFRNSNTAEDQLKFALQSVAKQLLIAKWLLLTANSNITITVHSLH